MTQVQKRRGWVKNVAIIFLAVMLVLTFLSNSIMNRSLPEVAAVYTQSGTINAKIRGSGTVEAVESYEVKSSQSRVVQSVPVRVGDEVSIGDVLILMQDADSNELQTAKDYLEQLQVAYQKTLLGLSALNYTSENRTISRARADLEALIADRDANAVTNTELASAQSAANTAQKKVDDLTDQIADVTEEMSGLTVGGASSGDSSLLLQLQTLQSQIDAAKIALETANLLHGANYAVFCAIAAKDAAAGTYTTAAYRQALYAKYSAAAASEAVDENGNTGGTGVTYNCNELAKAYNEIATCESSLASLEKTYTSVASSYAESFVGDDSVRYNKLKREKENLESQLKTATAANTTAQKTLEDLTAKKAAYDGYASQIKSAERTLEDLVYALAEQQQSDSNSEALQTFELQQARKEISEQEALVSKLSGEDGGAEITSSVNGVITAINVSAGNTATADSTLMTVEVVDRGYTLSFTVTTEQSRKVSVGDAAEVTTNWWGSSISATLIGVKNDTTSQANKQLVFSVSGDVSAGTSLSLSIGERSQNYDILVPNSAIRTDNNGDFVLIVETKSSPLGNRYIARRVDVTVLASDDTNSAVTGELTSWGTFVITTSAKPIESGMMVRLPDN